MAGNFSSAKNLSIAPPPVETKYNFLSNLYFDAREILSPPPITTLAFLFLKLILELLQCHAGIS